MRILLIRHGQDEPEYRGGWSQRGLIPQGHQQAQALALALSTKWQPIQHLSDLPRAAQTAAYCADALALPLQLDPAWRETNNGDLAGMHNELAKQRYPGLYFAALDMDEAYPNGESPRQNFERIRTVFTQLCQQIEARILPAQVAVVTHGGVINIIYYLLNKRMWTNKTPFYPIGATSIHEIRQVSGDWVVSKANNIEHLREENV
jgi:broad specificity phosphatase PhoE